MPPVKPKQTADWWLGVDPGNKGSASLLDSIGRPVLYDLKNSTSILSCRFDKCTPQEVAVFLSKVQSVLEAEYHAPRLHIILENVWCLQKGGRSTMFKFGKAAGMIEGMLTVFQVNYGYQLIKVIPTKWQTALGCKSGGDKKVTRLAAHKLWPKYASQITNDNADSMLIAEYGRRFCS